MRIFVYASVRLFGECLGTCLRRGEEVSAVLVAHEPSNLVERIARFEADIILFDVTPREQLAAVRSLVEACPSIPVVALAVPQQADDVIACADAGIVSYVPRDASMEELMGIIRMTLRGEVRCDPRIARSLFEELHRRRDRPATDERDEALTRREIQILGLMSQGLSNKEIAGELSLSVATVKNHVHAVLSKLHLQRRAQASEAFAAGAWIARPA